MTNTTFPQKELRTLSATFKPKGDKELQALAALDSAISAQDFSKYTEVWGGIINKLRNIESLEWGKLLSNLIVAMDVHHKDYTLAQKQKMLRQAIRDPKIPPDMLFDKLSKLIQKWGGQKEEIIPLTDEPAPAEESKPAESENAEKVENKKDSGAAVSFETFNEIKKLFAELLTQTLQPFVKSDEKLGSDVDDIAEKLLKADSVVALANLAADIKRLSFKLELFAEDHTAQTEGIFNLVRLLVDNAQSLSVGDKWLTGQMDMVKEVIDKPLSLRVLNEAERRLNDVVYKQNQIKADLAVSRGTLTALIAGFVEQIAGFSESTSVYHGKLSGYAQKISQIEDTKELEALLGEVMTETQEMQKQTQNTRDELTCAQERAKLAQARVSELEKHLEETSALITHDTLTGVLNRRGLDDVMTQEISRAQRTQQKLCVALLDLDNFKRLNDSYGHDAGDAALKHLTQTCKNSLRPQDSVARYGGEEFVIVLPGANAEEGQIVLQRVQRALTKAIFMHNNQKLLITFSAGVTELSPADTIDALIKRADSAMYAAKQSGKNRVLVSLA